MNMRNVAGAATTAGLLLAGLSVPSAAADVGTTSLAASPVTAQAKAAPCDVRGDRKKKDDCATHKHRGKAADSVVRAGSKFGLSVRMQSSLRKDLAEHVRNNRDSLGPRNTGMKLQVQYRDSDGKSWRTAHTRQWGTGKRGWPKRTSKVRVTAPKTAGAYKLRVRLVLPEAMRARGAKLSGDRASRTIVAASYPRAITSGASSLVAVGRQQVYQPIEFQVSNAQPGQRISIQLTGAGVQVAFSTGPSFTNTSGVEVTSLTGSLPLESVQLNASQLLFQTSPEGDGSTLTFRARMFLVGNDGVQLFYLRSFSDPGVEVTASVGNSIPQVVNLSQTLFSWNPI